MFIRTIHFFSRVAVVLVVLVMCYPNRYVFGMDLGDSYLQIVVFSLCVFLWSLSRGGQLRSQPYFEYESGTWEVKAATVKRNVVRISLEMLFLAGALEIVQVFLPNRHSLVGDFFVNALGIVAIAGVFYLLVALALRSPLGRHLAQFFATLD